MSWLHRGRKRIACIALWLCVGLFFCAADAPPKHHLVLTFDDTACVEALISTSSYAQGQVSILRERYAPNYRFERADDALHDAEALQDLWERTHAHWRAAEFERALEISSLAYDAVLTYQTSALDTALQALMQLRITLWLMLGDQLAATREAERLLSRGNADDYCENTDFPEACALLRDVESLTAYRWAASDQDLVKLQGFAETDGRALSVVTQDASALVLEHIEQGERTDTLRRTSRCEDPTFWADTLDAWEALLLAPPAFLAPPPPKPAIALERTLRIGVPIMAGIVGTMVIASTVHLHRRDRAFHHCADTPDICPTYAQIQDAYTRWRRARTWAVTSWSAAGVVAVAPIPLVLFKNRALRRAETAHQQRVDATR